MEVKKDYVKELLRVNAELLKENRFLRNEVIFWQNKFVKEQKNGKCELRPV